jgi:hypothetical protein
MVLVFVGGATSNLAKSVTSMGAVTEYIIPHVTLAWH